MTNLETPVEISLRKVGIIQLLANGYNTKEIAGILSITTKTVEAHVQQIKAKTSCATLSHIVAHFMRYGLVE